MHIPLEDKNLSPYEHQTIQSLLNAQNPELKDDLEQIWYLMDKVWYEMGCDNRNLDWEKIGAYYNHPVWILNGLFIESHELSMQIRQDIASYIAHSDFEIIVDYGGGFGSLAKTIAQKAPEKKILIYEPFPSEYSRKCIKDYPNINFIDTLPKEIDCIIATDVLEHVEDPLKTFEEMITPLKIGGEALIANCFHGCIQCHLPQNFHYRYTFNLFAKAMGLENLGILQNTHATIFKKIKNQKLHPSIKSLGGGASKVMFAIISSLEFARPYLRPIKRYIQSKLKGK
ncbi:methyltransferase domain-containing protein [Helicobacter sp. 11S02596-1]|uniref:class I SAM-dependent methyltransferase n=1 Tax=Helicobacter sp. 11S02596-1 TaxID=1476194 RepID=UPI000BA74927|nr:methyltransferase domain-containing protein [Helicobacter sp. 11S02596-1]PAF45197.1 hypothetical protein BJI48_01135 [Helicobacter sp. 11S02596-1]